MKLRGISRNYCDFCESKNVMLFTKDDSTEGFSKDICQSCIDECLKISSDKLLINKISMSFSAIAKRILDKDTRTLVKAGFLSNDLTLTPKGEEHLLSIMLQNNKADLIKDAEEVIEEESKK